MSNPVTNVLNKEKNSALKELRKLKKREGVLANMPASTERDVLLAQIQVDLGTVKKQVNRASYAIQKKRDKRQLYVSNQERMIIHYLRAYPDYTAKLLPHAEAYAEQTADLGGEEA